MTGKGAVSTTVLAVALTFGAASLDIGTYTRLGEVFASVMTGNLVLFGLATTRASTTLAIHTVIAFAGYSTGALVGVQIAGQPRTTGPIWPNTVTITLVLELVILAAFTVGWELTGAKPAGVIQLLLLAAAALTMGLQSVATRRLPMNVSTTYLTGTLIGVIMALTPNRPAQPDSVGHKAAVNRRGLAVLIAAVAGAVSGGALLAVFPIALPALPLIAIASVIILAATRPVR